MRGHQLQDAQSSMAQSVQSWAGSTLHLWSKHNVWGAEAMDTLYHHVNKERNDSVVVCVCFVCYYNHCYYIHMYKEQNDDLIYSNISREEHGPPPPKL